MKKIYVMMVLMLGAWTMCKAQDVQTNTGGKAIYIEDAGKYTVTIPGVSQNAAIGLLVEYAIKARVPEPQTISGYEVRFLEDRKLYEINDVSGYVKPGMNYPMYFTSIADARKHLKTEILAALTNL